MENKTIPYGDIRNQFAYFLKVLDETPFKFFFDNEEICPDKFAVLFDYLEPTLPIPLYVTMLRTENPDVTVPFFSDSPFLSFLDNKTKKDGVKVISFNSWVGYYSKTNTSFNEDFIVENNTTKNYKLMYKYLTVLQNCVLIINDFFLVLDAPRNYLNSIYQGTSKKTIDILSKLVGFYGNYILEKRGWIGQRPVDNRIYIYNPTVDRDRNNMAYIPIIPENANFPVTADLILARGGEGTNFFETIPYTRFNNVEARIPDEILDREIDRALRDNAHRTATECMELLRAAT